MLCRLYRLHVGDRDLNGGRAGGHIWGGEQGGALGARGCALVHGGHGALAGTRT